MTLTVKQIAERLNAEKARSAWKRGVILYAFDLLENLAEAAEWNGGRARIDRTAMLNGAQNWKEYSWGGSSLCYDGQIAKRLCAPYELRKTHNGAYRPNAREEWLDTQARALFQAAELLMQIVYEMCEAVEPGTLAPAYIAA